MNYVFGPTIHIKTKNRIRQYGNALLTRFPIESSRNHNHPFDFLPSFMENRGLLEVHVNINGKVISCFVTHLSFAPFLHQQQAKFVLSKVRETDQPTILMGDWNMRPSSKSYPEVTQHLIDAKSIDGLDYTFPSKRPKVKLDYIFVSDGIKVIHAAAYKINALASDHLPFVAEVEISKEIIV
ncbi:endonuclease/exonuclease/phosphatase family protein [Sutcliffiella cohnii]|nr:endonuclease/exonuclease/phosphatase family protein [Sutcliffiella cohnii]